MSPIRLSLSGLCLSLLVAAPACAFEQPKAELRLIEGAARDGALHAGLEIVLPKGALTYWRNPGEAGIPPVFDFSRSTNLAEATPLYPAPSKIDEAGSTVFGYAGRVVFPIRIAARDRAKPVDLALDLDYAICERICIPAKASLSARLAPGGAASTSVDQALASVPRAAALAEAGPLALLSATPAPAEGKILAAWTLSARAPGPAQLFPEAPAGYWIEADDPAPGGEPRFLLKLVEAPKERAARLPVRLTLVSGESAVETVLDLDLPKASP